MTFKSFNQSTSFITGDKTFVGPYLKTFLEKLNIPAVLVNNNQINQLVSQLSPEYNHYFFILATPGIVTSNHHKNFIKQIQKLLNSTRPNLRILIVYPALITSSQKKHSWNNQTSSYLSFLKTLKKLIKNNSAHPNLRLLKTMEVFGPHQPQNIQSPVISLFSQLNKAKIVLSGKPERLMSPIFVEDLVKQIGQTIFSRFYDPQHPSTVGGSQAQPIINLALTLKQQLSHAKDTELIEQTSSLSYQHKQTVSVPSNLSQALKTTLDWSNPIQGVRQVKRSTKPNIKRNRLLYLTLLVAIIIFIFPFVTLSFYLYETWQGINANNFYKIQSNSHSASFFAAWSKKHFNVVKPIIKLVSPTASQDATHFLSVVYHLLLSTDQMSQAAIIAQASFNSIFNTSSPTNYESLQEAATALNIAYEQLSLAQVNLNHLSQPIDILQSNVPKIRTLVLQSQHLVEITPELIGRDKKMTYLVLLQNSSELRPTGGFIGSFSLLTFDKGKLLDIETHDVYEADGQLLGHVEPPAPIKQYLGEGGWYLRDVNWDPDFPTTARQAEWFLDKELGRQVDGTIGINLYTVKNLLATIGPLELSDYQETISADNLFERAQYHSEINFFAGSTQKKDFLNSLATALYQKITIDSQLVDTKILSSLYQSSLQSQLQISLRDNDLESNLESAGLTGLIKDHACPQTVHSPRCIADYVSLVEANVGVNKANHFINRSLTHKVELGNTNIKETLTLNLVNTAASHAWPAGPYKAYIRLYTPITSSLDTITIDNQQLLASSIDTTSEHQKRIYGFYTQVPINSSSTIVISYHLNQKFTKLPQEAYSLYFAKQPGTNTDPLTLSILPPPGFKPIIPEGNTIEVSLESDQTLTREYIKDLVTTSKP